MIVENISKCVECKHSGQMTLCPCESDPNFRGILWCYLYNYAPTFGCKDFENRIIMTKEELRQKLDRRNELLSKCKRVFEVVDKDRNLIALCNNTIKHT